MPNTPPIQAHTQVGGGRFVLIQPLGRGGMGEVWLARDGRLGELVALKFLPPEVQADPGAIDDLRRETARSHKLTHPNIVRIHDLHEDAGGQAFIAMEYVDGPTLSALRVEQPNRVLPWDYLKSLVQQLCAALDYAHGEDVIHRDLKPGNIMVDSRGRLKLADFGIAATVTDSASRASAHHATTGTLPYMSPQQVAGKRPQVTDDIYGLGATLYELLTGKPPFHTGDITYQVLHEPPEPVLERLAQSGIQNDIPPDAAAILMACLAKDPTQRPQNARAMAEWIGLEVVRRPSTETISRTLFGEGEPDEKVEAAESRESRKPATTRPKASLISAGVALALLLVTGGAAYIIRNKAGGANRTQLPSATDFHKPIPDWKVVASVAPTQGLVLYYNFDHLAENGQVTDQSGKANDGTVVNAEWTPKGQRGGAYQFGRTNSYLSVPNYPSLNPSAISVAAWVKTSYSDHVWRRIFDKSWSTGFALSDGGETGKFHEQGRLIWEVGGHSCGSRQRFDDGKWHHVAGTFDGKVQKVFLDGVAQPRTIQWEGRVPENNYDLTIAGNRSDPDPKFGEVGASFDGVIDEIMIFNRALTEEEIRALAEPP